MLARFRLRHLFVIIAAAFLGGTAQAQGLLEEPVRIGVVLPEAPSETTDSASPLQAALARSAAQGATLATEEFTFNAELFGIEFSVFTRNANGAEGVVAAAEALLEEHDVFALIGGFSLAEASALGDLAQSRNVPFINVGASADVLRNQSCFATTFHVEPSAAMYLDALAGWFVHSGFRRWHFILVDTAEAQAQYARVRWSLQERHFGAAEVGRTVIEPGAGANASVANAVRNSRADLIVLLLDADDQLRVLADLEAAGIDALVAGFPYPETQTRTFFAASREVAPNLGTNFRATAWEATLDAYGAREINARYLGRWNEPMEAAAWATYQGVKILFEAALFGGSTASQSVISYLTAPQSVFDVWKGIGTSFRPWDRQLRQSLYLVAIDETATDAFRLALLIGELPAIYMPGTDPNERLDQLGDLAARSLCTP